MKENKKPVVLFCPLNWGLGHASRLVMLIRAFIQLGCRVYVGADGMPMAFLKKEFGDAVSYVPFSGKEVTYPEKGTMVLKMLKQLPGLLSSIGKEKRELKKILEKTGAGIVISDNRYGLFSKKAKTVFITHQLFIMAPKGLKWLEPLLFNINRFFISRYDHCWIPDHEKYPNLSGKLSHKKPLKKTTFIGPLSRFASQSAESFKNPLPLGFPKDYCLGLISGPEPQRTFFEKILLKQLKKEGTCFVLLRGLAQSNHSEKTENGFIMDHASSAAMQYLIKNARLVICRPGYSTIMDLSVFGKKALLIPTPGQTEQEYLGRYMQENQWAPVVKQTSLSLEKHTPLAVSYQGIPRLLKDKNVVLHTANELLKSIQ